jgi:hypothetical protein
MDVDLLAELQDMLCAQDRWAVLFIFQAMGAAGKDGAIKHVHIRCQPAGLPGLFFQGPSSENLDHDYLWRCLKCLPERGRIGIFNRSCSWKLAGTSPSGAVRGGLCVCHTGYRVPTPRFDSGRRFRPGFRRPAREHESLGSGSRDQVDMEWVRLYCMRS